MKTRITRIGSSQAAPNVSGIETPLLQKDGQDRVGKMLFAQGQPVVMIL
jgi:hypothetical protein